MKQQHSNRTITSQFLLVMLILSAAFGLANAGAENVEETARSPFTLENLELVVTDMSGQEISVLYPKDGPYVFEATIQIYGTLNSLESVTLELDADGYGVKLQWNQIENEVTEIYDPHDFISVGDTDIISENNGADTWYIRFPVIFNWNFPEADSVPCRIISEGFTGDKYSDVFADVFDFENDLAFYGELQVKNSDDEIISEDSWIPAFETMTWSGLRAIFESSEIYGEPVSPNLPGLNFKLSEETSGNFWLAPAGTKSELSAKINSGTKTIQNAKFIITLEGLPSGVELISAKSFTLGIDAEPLEFFDAVPEDPDVYFKSPEVRCGISVKDLGGSGVDVSTLEYAVSIHGINNYGPWKSLDGSMYEISEKGDYVIITMDATFADGAENYIKWRGRDNAGNGDKNGYYESGDVQIRIDVASIDNYSPIIILDHPKDNTVYKPVELITFSAMDSYDPDGDQLTFTWSSNISGVLSSDPYFQQELEPGLHEITLQVKDSHGNTASKTLELRIEEFDRPAFSDSEDEGGLAVWETPQATYGTFTLIMIALVYFFTGTEIGKYKFLGLMIPLYSKLTKRMVLDHETRGMIRGYIIANPGDHFTSIKKQIGLKNGTLAYHLKILERENIIKSHRDGIFKRFYPINVPITADMVHLSKQEMILNTVIENPGISRKDLAQSVNLSRQVVNYHAKSLIQAGLIRSEKYGKKIQYYANEPLSS